MNHAPGSPKTPTRPAGAQDDGPVTPQPADDPLDPARLGSSAARGAFPPAPGRPRGAAGVAPGAGRRDVPGRCLRDAVRGLALRQPGLRPHVDGVPVGGDLQRRPLLAAAAARRGSRAGRGGGTPPPPRPGPARAGLADRRQPGAGRGRRRLRAPAHARHAAARLPGARRTSAGSSRSAPAPRRAPRRTTSSGVHWPCSTATSAGASTSGAGPGGARAGSPGRST